MNLQTTGGNKVIYQGRDKLISRVMDVRASGYLPYQYGPVFEEFFPEFCDKHPDYKERLNQIMAGRVRKSDGEYVDLLEKLVELLKVA